MTNVLPAGELTLNSLVSEAFVQFFVEIVGHYSLHMSVTEQGQRVFQREPFRKSHGSRTVRHFLHCFMETQMFAGFIQDRELSKSLAKGLASPSLLLGLASSFCSKSASQAPCRSTTPRASAVGILSHGIALCPPDCSKKDSVHKANDFCQEFLHLSPLSLILLLTHVTRRIFFHGLVNHDATC